MSFYRLDFILLVASLLASSVRSAELEGVVVRVNDGDTLSVRTGAGLLRVRLFGVDAPERRQDGGLDAYRFTSSLALHQEVRVLEQEIDRYGRSVSVVMLPNDVNLGHSLVRTGNGWWYRKYAPDDAELAAFEQEARSKRLGLWASSTPIAPWDWRKQRRDGCPCNARLTRRSVPRSQRRSLRPLESRRSTPSVE